MGFGKRLRKAAQAVGGVAKKVGGVAKQAVSMTPAGSMLGGLGKGGGGGDMGARSSAARSLIRRTRQAGAGQISTMSEE